MCLRMRLLLAGFVLVLSLGPFIRSTEAQVRVEGVFPRQLPRGQETVVNVAVQNQDKIQAVEVSPSPGVSVSGIKAGENFQGAYAWSELRITVAADATPGQRTMVLVLPSGRTVPITIIIPAHVPVISDLRGLSAQSSPLGLDLEFSAVDRSDDIGDSPYVWFMLICGSDIVPGIVHGKVTGRDKGAAVIHATVPGATVKGKCDLQVRVADSGGIESNTLRAPL